MQGKFNLITNSWKLSISCHTVRLSKMSFRLKQSNFIIIYLKSLFYYFFLSYALTQPSYWPQAPLFSPALCLPTSQAGVNVLLQPAAWQRDASWHLTSGSTTFCLHSPLTTACYSVHTPLCHAELEVNSVVWQFSHWLYVGNHLSFLHNA